MDGAGGADLLADAAADAAGGADCTGILALILVGALDNDKVGALVNLNQVQGACLDAGTTGDALFLIDFGDADVVDGDGTELTCDDTLLAGDAAVGAALGNISVGAAAAVAGHDSSLVGELLLDSHNSFPLLTCYRACHG